VAWDETSILSPLITWLEVSDGLYIRKWKLMEYTSQVEVMIKHRTDIFSCTDLIFYSNSVFVFWDLWRLG